MFVNPRVVPERPRIDLSIDVAVVKWINERLGTGDPFTGESQAVELAVARFQAEQAFVRAACKREGVPFEGEAFWDLYSDEIEASTPSRRGRRPRRTPAP